MKLLFDQNLSDRLARALADVFPSSLHLRDIGMGASSDSAVWEYARLNGFAIISKDSDFHRRSMVIGHPPKVIWSRLGNCSTQEIERIRRRESSAITHSGEDAISSFLILP